MTKLNSKNIKRGLKEKCYLYKQHFNNIKSGILGSEGLAILESLIEDNQPLKDKFAKLSDELNQLTEQ